MDIPGAIETARPILVAFGLKVVGAIAAYIIGRMLIGFASSLVMKALERQKVEPTVIRYIGSIITVALKANVAQLTADVAALKATVARLCGELGIAAP